MRRLAASLFVALLPAALPALAQEELSLVETVPVGTTLGSPEIPDTFEVWSEMFRAAERGIDLAFFYASNRPEEPGQGRLEPLVAELEAAAGRGVRVRFLADVKFYATYPATLDRLNAREGIDMRLYDIRERTGGILHAKYFLVDGREAYLGSANFDWRSLEHIQELGVRFRIPEAVRPLQAVFEMDWGIAGGASVPMDGASRATAASFRGEKASVTPVFSPRTLLPEGAQWDLPRLVEMIDSAKESVCVQLLSYKTTDREGRYFDDLETALRSAAARGVAVRLLLADWNKREHSIEGLQSLQALRNVEVSLVSLPRAEEGFIPFARVIHSKYMVVDSERSWIGTSNWSRDYFHGSRNVGLVIESAALGAELAEYFERGWGSPYAERVDPSRHYEAPRVQ